MTDDRPRKRQGPIGVFVWLIQLPITVKGLLVALLLILVCAGMLEMVLVLQDGERRRMRAQKSASFLLPPVTVDQ